MDDALARRFDAERPRLLGLAQRLLGSRAEAEDVVQDAWLRLSRSDPSAVVNLGGWLTTVVSRLCLDALRSRTARREDVVDLAVVPGGESPEDTAVLGDAVGAALLVVLDALTPNERLAFVLHDVFAVPFDEIAQVLEMSAGAARQLASRGRRKVQGTTAVPDPHRQREVVNAFLAASRDGDFDALLRLLHPDVVLGADAATVAQGAEELVVGASAVARTFGGRARAARPALIDGLPGLVWMVGGQPRVVFAFTIVDGLVTGIALRSDDDYLSNVRVALLGS